MLGEIIVKVDSNRDQVGWWSITGHGYRFDPAKTDSISSPRRLEN